MSGPKSEDELVHISEFTLLIAGLVGLLFLVAIKIGYEKEGKVGGGGGGSPH